jgi:hypothetical protein
MKAEIKLQELKDAAEMLWVVLANVSEGDWTKQTEEWQKAAARWRDNYFMVIGGIKQRNDKRRIRRTH